MEREKGEMGIRREREGERRGKEGRGVAMHPNILA